MKTILAFLIVVLIWLPVLAVLPCNAFHEGGVASCDGCHIIHNSAEGQGNQYLLLASSSSSVCLICHESTVQDSYVVSTSRSVLAPGIPPIMMTPGGDFAWLSKSYTWVYNSTVMSEDGDRHGHNIVAQDFNYQADNFNSTAPGGTFLSSALHCTSCHDPHGQYRINSEGIVSTSGEPIYASGSESELGLPVNPNPGQAVGTYRLLAGVGYKPKGAGQPFWENPPAGMAPKDYNRSELATQTRVAYGEGTSRWCTNCHGEFHGLVGDQFYHPFERVMPSNMRNAYDSYIKTNDLNGISETSFLSLVPFEVALGNSMDDRNALAVMARSDDSYLWGPSPQDKVGCLTCHRAHSSGWRNMLRWNPDAEYLTYGGVFPGLDNGAPASYHMGRTEVETRRGYYDRTPDVFGTNQNQLCEKCHP